MNSFLKEQKKNTRKSTIGSFLAPQVLSDLNMFNIIL